MKDNSNLYFLFPFKKRYFKYENGVWFSIYATIISDFEIFSYKLEVFKKAIIKELPKLFLIYVLIIALLYLGGLL